MNRRTRKHKHAHMLKPMLSVAIAVVAAILFYAWVQLGLVSSGYELSRYMNLERKLTKQHAKLKMEVATLSQPAHLRRVAVQRWGMHAPGKGEISYIRLSKPEKRLVVAQAEQVTP